MASLFLCLLCLFAAIQHRSGTLQALPRMSGRAGESSRGKCARGVAVPHHDRQRNGPNEDCAGEHQQADCDQVSASDFIGRPGLILQLVEQVFVKGLID